MSKTFTYTKITGHYYCSYSNDWEQDGVEFDYEVSNSRLLPVLVDLMFEEYFGEEQKVAQNKEMEKLMKAKLKEMIEGQDMVERLAENYEEMLKEVFQEEALEWYNS